MKRVVLAVEIDIRHIGRNAVLRVEGDVDMGSSPALRDAILRLLRDRSEFVVLNLSGVDYVDSSGVASLVEGLQEARRLGTGLRLAGLQPKPRHVLKITGLLDLFDLRDSEVQALEA